MPGYKDPCQEKREKGETTLRLESTISASRTRDSHDVIANASDPLEGGSLDYPLPISVYRVATTDPYPKDISLQSKLLTTRLHAVFTPSGCKYRYLW